MAELRANPSMTTVATPAETVAELGFGVEVSVSAAGEVGLRLTMPPTCSACICRRVTSG